MSRETIFSDVSKERDRQDSIHPQLPKYILHPIFDSTKKLVEIIPEVLLRMEPNLDPEVEPRNSSTLSDSEKAGTKASATSPKATETPKANEEKPEE